ncbi:SOS response-associated peptidase [Alkalihalobacillus oceani]|uniref:Abasic site processing protein n=1 Tax=Halalkalibacter oceani TaxID=1653776 RepID=A0A9X2DV27_9BACI|nr:SOS response-associated peptidase [Halalkalibacter oceani]MCM3716067.1 SOS response-associated peptidase [Halalkalibacter oceani]
MCGRFTLTATKGTLQEQFSLPFPEFTPNYNVAPSQQILAIVSGGNEKKAGFLHWGLVPSWAKDKKIGYKMINARSETLDEKPAFKRLLSRRRCLIPADGFYEWKREDDGKTKQPFRITIGNGQLFTFAGLWDKWRTEEEEYFSCTIITTKPNQLMESIHDRMPVILEGDDQDIWLNKDIEDKHILKNILNPYDANNMSAYPVSTLVNNPRNNNEACIDPLS